MNDGQLTGYVYIDLNTIDYVGFVEFTIAVWEVCVQSDWSRRKLLRDFFGIGVAVAGVPLVAEALQTQLTSAKGIDKEPEVAATEDLMREHGVIRRALLVYFESIPKLRQSPSSLDPAALHRTAELFRTFGEDYHERMLEEQHIFLWFENREESSRNMQTSSLPSTTGDARSPIMCWPS